MECKRDFRLCGSVALATQTCQMGCNVRVDLEDSLRVDESGQALKRSGQIGF